MDGRRLLTDPVLGQRVAHLRRHSAPVTQVDPIDAVMISHAHRDHLDVRSLRRLGADTRLIVPDGVGAMLRAKGFSDVEELAVDATAAIGPMEVLAVPAVHRTKRTPLGRESPTLGFRLQGAASLVFFGDTDVFDGMAALGPVDVALLPVWGWGPTIGRGHLDPERAARAVALMRPRVAIPIHWGSFAPAHLSMGRAGFLERPGPEFARQVARLGGDVEVRVLAPGDSTVVASTAA